MLKCCEQIHKIKILYFLKYQSEIENKSERKKTWIAAV